MRNLDELTQQELKILALVASGWRSAKIADELSISVRTVENHLYHIFDKLGVSTRTEAALYALQSGLLLTNEEMSARSHDAKTTLYYASSIS